MLHFTHPADSIARRKRDSILVTPTGARVADKRILRLIHDCCRVQLGYGTRRVSRQSPAVTDMR